MEILKNNNTQYCSEKTIGEIEKILCSEPGLNLTKIIYNYLYSTSSYNRKVTEEDWANNLIRNEITTHMINILTTTNNNLTNNNLTTTTNNNNNNFIREIGVYTTGEVANYLDVSVQTVNEWIKTKKISPAHRTQGDSGQWRIPIDATVRLRNGKTYELREVIEEKEGIINRSKNASYEEELKSIEEELAYYERKYPDYFKLFYSKERTEEEDRDLKLWVYWQQRYVDECHGSVAMG